MKVLKEAHLYELESMEGANPQRLQFIEKENKYGELVTINDGTTNEEVLEVLIDRITELNHILPCRENIQTLTKLEEALMWLHRRTANRGQRDVEGTPFSHEY